MSINVIALLGRPVTLLGGDMRAKKPLGGEGEAEGEGGGRALDPPLLGEGGAETLEVAGGVVHVGLRHLHEMQADGGVEGDVARLGAQAMPSK